VLLYVSIKSQWWKSWESAYGVVFFDGQFEVDDTGACCCYAELFDQTSQYWCPVMRAVFRKRAGIERS
jgi:hypothetical protein